MSFIARILSNSAFSRNPDVKVAADVINDADYQLSKVVLGDIGDNDGPISSSNPLPVSSSTSTLTASSPDSASVGTSSSEVVAANSSRKGLVLINLSSNNISIAFGVTAVAGSGVTLTPNGAFTMNEFSFSTAAINAVSTGASSNLAIQEFS